MNIFEYILKTIDTNIIFCLIPTLLALITVELLTKDRFETKKALNLIRWFLIIYASTNFIYALVIFNYYPEDSAFLNRATGPYFWAYWLMFFSAILLPFTLLIKKLGSSYLYVLLIAFLIKIGVYFERFVIIITSFHRDYGAVTYSKTWYDPLIFNTISLIIQGCFIAFLLLAVLESIKFLKLKNINKV
jgi:hypothetical protein